MTPGDEDVVPWLVELVREVSSLVDEVTAQWNAAAYTRGELSDTWTTSTDIKAAEALGSTSQGILALGRAADSLFRASELLNNEIDRNLSR